jgi:hypothetical protein
VEATGGTMRGYNNHGQGITRIYTYKIKINYFLNLVTLRLDKVLIKKI